MDPIKKAIAQKIGSTHHQKMRVWQKLHQPQKKKKTPYAIAAIFTAVLLFYIASFFPTQENNVKEPSNNENIIATAPATTTSNNAENVPIYSTQSINVRTISYMEDYSVKQIETKEVYEQIAKLFHFNVENVDFTSQQVFLVEFISDGCGREITSLQLADTQLQITLDFPKALRNEKEVACTSIANPNTIILVTPKIQVTSAVFFEIPGGFTHKASFENVMLKQPNNLISDFPVEKITIKLNSGGNSINITKNEIIDDIVTIFTYAQQQPGIVNIVQPQFQVMLYSALGEKKQLLLTFDDNITSASVLDGSNTNTVYTLDAPLAQKLFDFMQEQ